MLQSKSYNGGTKPPYRGAGFAFSAKSVTRVAVGFSELLCASRSPNVCPPHTPPSANTGRSYSNYFQDINELLCLLEGFSVKIHESYSYFLIQCKWVMTNTWGNETLIRNI